MAAKFQERGCSISSFTIHSVIFNPYDHRYFQTDVNRGLFVKKQFLCRELRILQPVATENSSELRSQLTKQQAEHDNLTSQLAQLGEHCQEQVDKITTLEQACFQSQVTIEELQVTIEELRAGETELRQALLARDMRLEHLGAVEQQYEKQSGVITSLQASIEDLRMLSTQSQRTVDSLLAQIDEQNFSLSAAYAFEVLLLLVCHA